MNAISRLIKPTVPLIILSTLTSITGAQAEPIDKSVSPTRTCDVQIIEAKTLIDDFFLREMSPIPNCYFATDVTNLEIVRWVYFHETARPINNCIDSLNCSYDGAKGPALPSGFDIDSATKRRSKEREMSISLLQDVKDTICPTSTCQQFTEKGWRIGGLVNFAISEFQPQPENCLYVRLVIVDDMWAPPRVWEDMLKDIGLETERDDIMQIRSACNNISYLVVGRNFDASIDFEDHSN